MDNLNDTTSNIPVFVLTLPMQDEPWQNDNLDKVFSAGNDIKNLLIEDRKHAIEQLYRTKAWRENQAQISAVHEEFKAKHPAAEKKSSPEVYAAALEDKKHCLAVLYETRNAMLKEAGFTKTDFEKRILKYSSHYTRPMEGRKQMVGLIPSQAVQKIADEVWAEFKDYIYGKGKTLTFSKWTDFTYISSKTNKTGIVFSLNEERYWESELLFNGMRIRLKINPPDKDVYCYEEEALKRPVRYAGISRRWYKDGWRYFAVLTLAGKPPVKHHRYTGVIRHPMGKGRVGHDIGTQTLAASSNTETMLVELADRVKGIDKELRRLNRAMDRSRRAMNPKMFKADGTIVPINQLPKECLSRDGTRRFWKKSKRYKRLEAERRELYRRQKECRILQHNELANKVIALGNEHYIEKMDFSALARRSKETKKNSKGKYISKKRFGKSVSNKAPATFVNILEKKLARAGGSLTRINTRKAKASQYNHKTFEYKKKKLSKRWDDVGGHKVQRDLYSAFLISNTNAALDGFDQALCDAGFENFLILHDKEVARLVSLDICCPSSMGIKKKTA